MNCVYFFCNVMYASPGKVPNFVSHKNKARKTWPVIVVPTVYVP